MKTEKAKIRRRERIEWVNYWWEDANDYSKERWLLLGDSVVRQIRETLNSMVGRQIVIDYFGSSAYIDDELLVKEIRDFFSVQDYRYNIIFINLGFHHGMSRSVAEIEEDKINFRNCYDNIIELCAASCEKIVILSGTPEVQSDDLDKLDVKVNTEIVARNKVVSKLCESKGYEYVDLFDYFHERHSQYRHRDHVHFVRNADSVMARLMCKVVMHNWCGFEEKVEINVLNLIEFENLIKDSPIYLYGAGVIGNELRNYIELRGGKIAGFIVSDGQEKSHVISGKEVFWVSEKLQELKKSVLILAMENPFKVESVIANNALTAYYISNDNLDFVRNLSFEVNIKQ